MAWDNYVMNNSNGSKYFVIDEFKGNGLLRNMETGEYVIAWSFDICCSSWGSGKYFGQNYDSVTEKWQEMKSE